MEVLEFDTHWATLHRSTKQVLRSFAKSPTERNSCYTIGYLAALDAHGLIDDDAYTYMLALVGSASPEILAHLLQCEV